MLPYAHRIMTEIQKTVAAACHEAHLERRPLSRLPIGHFGMLPTYWN